MYAAETIGRKIHESSGVLQAKQRPEAEASDRCFVPRRRGRAHPHARAHSRVGTPVVSPRRPASRSLDGRDPCAARFAACFWNSATLASNFA